MHRYADGDAEPAGHVHGVERADQRAVDEVVHEFGHEVQQHEGGQGAAAAGLLFLRGGLFLCHGRRADGLAVAAAALVAVRVPTRSQVHQSFHRKPGEDAAEDGPAEDTQCFFAVLFFRFLFSGFAILIGQFLLLIILIILADSNVEMQDLRSCVGQKFEEGRAGESPDAESDEFAVVIFDNALRDD